MSPAANKKTNNAKRRQYQRKQVEVEEQEQDDATQQQQQQFCNALPIALICVPADCYQQQPQQFEEEETQSTSTTDSRRTRQSKQKVATSKQSNGRSERRKASEEADKKISEIATYESSIRVKPVKRRTRKTSSTQKKEQARTSSRKKSDASVVETFSDDATPVEHFKHQSLDSAFSVSDDEPKYDEIVEKSRRPIVSDLKLKLDDYSNKPPLTLFDDEEDEDDDDTAVCYTFKSATSAQVPQPQKDAATSTAQLADAPTCEVCANKRTTPVAVVPSSPAVRFFSPESDGRACDGEDCSTCGSIVFGSTRRSSVESNSESSSLVDSTPTGAAAGPSNIFQRVICNWTWNSKANRAADIGRNVVDALLTDPNPTANADA